MCKRCIRTSVNDVSDPNTPARPALHVSTRLFLLLLRTRSCAIRAEALSHRLNEVFAFLGRAMPDRAGARPYQLKVRRRMAYQSQRHRLTAFMMRLPDERGD